MPRSVDPANYTANYNPLTSMLTSFNMGDIAEEVLEALEAAAEALLNEVIAIIQQLTGIDLSGFASFIENLASAFGFFGITTIEEFVTAIEGLFSGFGSGSILTQLISAAGGIGTELSDFANLFSIRNIVGLLDEGGSIVAGLLSGISVGSLTNAQPNLLPAPTFAPDAIGTNPDWTIDATSTRTADGTGSLMATANGWYKACRSGSSPVDLISAGSRQTLTGTIYVKNQGYSGNGSTIEPVQLEIVPFMGAVAGTPVALDTYTPTADVGWPGHQMTGTYVVPDGVTGVQLRVLITNTAQTGTFWFDDASLTQAATVPQSFIGGLEDILTTIQNLWQSLADTIASALSGIPIIGATLSQVATALGSINPANILGSLGSINLIGDVSGIINHLIDAVRGQPAGTSTTGSLADLYNTVNQAINNTASEDVTTFYDTTTIVPIPAWANQIDLVGIGGGQAGEQGEILNFFGQGGQPGKINATSLLRGTHYDSGTASVTVTVNTDGSITLAVPAGTSTTAHSITAAIGSGSQSPHFGSGYVGIGPGPYTYNGKPYAGGGNQNTTGAAGLGPGGGGAGGNGTFFQPGGASAPGGGWVRFLATAIIGGSTGADVTPPSGGVGAVVSATNTSITVQASGAADS